MAEWIRTVRGALLFNSAFYTEFESRRDVFLRGVLIVTVVALIATLPGFIVELADALGGHAASAAEMADARREFDSIFEQMAPFMQGLTPEERAQALAQARQSFMITADIRQRIDALPAALPRPIGWGLEALGNWLSRPFGGSFLPLAAATLGTWLGYGLWVMLAARLLGGRGDMAGFFGATSLYAVPHLLNILSPAPILGPLLWFVALIWGLAIYIKATAVNQRFGIERALLAVALPALAAIALLIVAGFGLVALIALAAGGQ